MKELNLNGKEIPIGSVVYFLSTDGHSKKIIKYGTVVEHYVDKICIQLYDYCERRMINGIPVEKFDTPTRWQKLPKGWSYDTKLFELSSRPLPDAAKMLKLNNSSDILKAIEIGFLVKIQNLDYAKFESVIDKNKGWRIERKYPRDEHHPFYICVPFYKVYTTYEQAKSVLDAELAELERQSNLSEYDWSIEQIDEKLNFWEKAHDISDEEKKKIRDWILSLDKVEDVEIRLFDGTIQWKYWNRSRWMKIEY